MSVGARDGRAGGVFRHAFISYVREDSPLVDRLQHRLQSAGVRVWRDTADLWPGEDWRAKIRQAIRDDALVFIACFSQRSITRSRSYQNEELALAIEELRSRRPGDPWLIPVRFSDCDIPEIDIGMGRTLRSIQRADLFGDREEENATRLVKSVSRILRFTADISPTPIQDPAPSQTQEPIPLVRPITQGRTEATLPVSPSAPARRKPRRTVIMSAAIVILLAGAGVDIWLSPLTVNTCARTSSAPSVPVELGSMSVGRPGLNKDFIGATFGPDCQVLATGGNGTVHVWNMVTGHRIAALPVFPGGWAFGAAFSPDGKTIAVPASDGTETLWDVASGHLKGTLNSDPNGNTFCARLSTDGATLFTGGTTGIVDEWDVAARKLVRTIPTPGIGSLALSPGGKVLAVGGADGTQRLFDVASGRKVATLVGHQGNSFALAFSPDGRTLAVGTMSGGVQWWDVASGKRIAQGTGSVTDVAFSPDGKILASGGYDAITLWDASTHQPITTLSLGSVGVYVSGLAFSRYGGVLAVGYNGALQLWNVAGVSRISQLSKWDFCGHAEGSRSRTFRDLGLQLSRATRGWAREA
jgi:hypothetical protein